MKKYIDADKLKEIVDRVYNQYVYDYGLSAAGSNMRWIYDAIDSLQQEQQEPVKGKFVFPKFLYARTLDNKTIDVSYCPQDMTAIEYIRNDFVEQERTRVDLEKEIEEHVLYMPHGEFASDNECTEDDEWARKEFRHFYELGLNAGKEE